MAKIEQFYQTTSDPHASCFPYLHLPTVTSGDMGEYSYGILRQVDTTLVEHYPFNNILLCLVSSYLPQTWVV